MKDRIMTNIPDHDKAKVASDAVALTDTADTPCIGCHGTGIVRHMRLNQLEPERCPAHYGKPAQDEQGVEDRDKLHQKLYELEQQYRYDARQPANLIERIWEVQDKLGKRTAAPSVELTEDAILERQMVANDMTDLAEKNCPSLQKARGVERVNPLHRDDWRSFAGTDKGVEREPCEHPQSRVRMNGICMDCERQVRPYDCDCGICNFCNGQSRKPHGADGTCETGDCGPKPEREPQGAVCPKCGYGWLTHRWLLNGEVVCDNTKPWKDDTFVAPDTANDHTPELSLLVIDLGDSCVVQVEKGDMSEKGIIPQLCYYVSGIARTRVGNVILFDVSFGDFQDAVRRHFGKDEKHVPKRFYVTEDVQNLQDVLMFNDMEVAKDRNGREALCDMAAKLNYIVEAERCEIAGHPLPIYSPKPGGEWKQLGKQLLGKINNGDTFELTDELPVKIYRFTR